MTAPNIRVTDMPSPADLETIGTKLSAFNDSDVGPANRRPLAALMEVNNQLVAGLSGYTAWGWAYIQLLWVSEGSRGQGLARQLLLAAEAEATLRGCHGAYIDTFSPQALHVYQQAGYTVFGALPDFPVGRTRTFLSKSLP